MVPHALMLFHIPLLPFFKNEDIWASHCFENVWFKLSNRCLEKGWLTSYLMQPPPCAGGVVGIVGGTGSSIEHLASIRNNTLSFRLFEAS